MATLNQRAVSKRRLCELDYPPVSSSLKSSFRTSNIQLQLPKMKFALLSVTYAGLFYKGKALTLEEQVYKAKQLGFTGLAIETKRPIASPLDLSKADRKNLKALAADEGIELCCVESLSNF